jgi:hypothetical protein
MFSAFLCCISKSERETFVREEEVGDWKREWETKDESNKGNEVEEMERIDTGGVKGRAGSFPAFVHGNVYGLCETVAHAVYPRDPLLLRQL